MLHRLRVSSAFVGLFIAASGCKHEAPLSSAVVDAAPAITDAGVGAAAIFTVDASTLDARAVVLAWNHALDTHDVAALGPLYAERVKLYGSELSRAAVLKAKQSALSAKSTFHQQIVGDLTVVSDDPGTFRVTFKKHSGPAGKMFDVPARLVLSARDGGAPVIVEETDDVTDKVHVEARCEEESARAVNALPEVASIVKAGTKAADESNGHQFFGGMGPILDEGGGFTEGLGTHTDERFEAEVWYTVDPTGDLSVTVLGNDVAIPPAVHAMVERACGRGDAGPTSQVAQP